MGIEIMKCANPKCDRRVVHNYCCTDCAHADITVSAEESFLGRGRAPARHSSTCNERERVRISGTSI